MTVNEQKQIIEGLKELDKILISNNNNVSESDKIVAKNIIDLIADIAKQDIDNKNGVEK